MKFLRTLIVLAITFMAFHPATATAEDEIPTLAMYRQVVQIVEGLGDLHDEDIRRTTMVTALTALIKQELAGAKGGSSTQKISTLMAEVSTNRHLVQVNSSCMMQEWVTWDEYGHILFRADPLLMWASPSMIVARLNSSDGKSFSLFHIEKNGHIGPVVIKYHEGQYPVN